MNSAPSSLVRRWLGEPFGGFLGSLITQETIGGLILTAALVLGVFWASVFTHSYNTVVSLSISIPTIPSSMVHDVSTLVTNLAMLIFFAAIGLEIGRERAVGALQKSDTALPPVIAALGGMAMAAVTYLIVVAAEGNSAALGGWGIPMATDVAFTLGALSLIGSRVSRELRVFLLTLAVADDVAAVIILGMTSHHGHRLTSLGVVAYIALCVVIIALTLVARRLRLSLWTFVFLALGLWWAFAHLGIEPTLAGVIVGVCVPTGDDPHSPGLRLERVVTPLSTFVVLPIFAILVGGVDLTSQPWKGNWGLIGALVGARSIGKIIGITGGVALAIKCGYGSLPKGTSWRQMSGAALLCGIGFTVPLLFATRDFAGSSSLLSATKVALLMASILCAGIGLWIVAKRSKNPSPEG